MDGLTVSWDDGDNVALRIEAVLGGNLPENTAGVDTYSSADGGTAISVKTIDPRYDSYRQNPGSIGTIGIRYVDALAEFRDVPGHTWNPLIQPDAISVWVLRYALPASTLSDPKIQEALERVLKRG
jgi:hypothetical protein